MNNKITGWCLVLLLGVLVFSLRSCSISLAPPSMVAKEEVLAAKLSSARAAVEDKYPGFSADKKEALALQMHKRSLRNNKYNIDEAIRQKAGEKKAFYQNEAGHTYIFGIDSYYWLRLIKNLVTKCHIGEKVVSNKQYDELVGTTIEDSLSRSIHLRLGQWLYALYNIAGYSPDYEIGLFVLPVLFSLLLVVASFWVTKLLTNSNVAAFFASIAINLSPLLLQRTLGEWLDTDIYNVFFPLVIFGSFLFVFKSASRARKIIGLASFCVLCALYASVWQGWWFIFDLLILCGCIFILNDYFSEHKDKKLLKKDGTWLLSLFIGGLVCVGILNGTQSALSFLTEAAKTLSVLRSVPQDNWPNVFLTVAELKTISPSVIAAQLGGFSIFLVTIIGSIYFILSKKIMRDKMLGIGFFSLFIWLGTMYYVSLNAIRLVLLLIVPIGLVFGIVFATMLEAIHNRFLKTTKRMRFLYLGVMVILIYFVISSYVTRSIVVAFYKVPMMNDAWVKSIEFIKNDSCEDAVINSWWDFGHWFTSIGERRVLFDGKTQNSPIAYWMAHVLTTDNEQEAVGILRMLNLSGNKAFELIESYGVSHRQAIKILQEIAVLEKEQSRKYLASIFGQEKIEPLIELLYADTMPEAYFIASYDMIGKIGSISRIGNWDFEKGDIWIQSTKLRPIEFMQYLKKEYGYDEEKLYATAQQVRMLGKKNAADWISRVDNFYIDSMSNKSSKKANTLLFDNGMVLDTGDYTMRIIRGQSRDISVPYSVAYLQGDELQEKIQDNSTLPYSVLIFTTGSDEPAHRCIALDKALAKSLFVRMYFMQGKGLKFFKKVHEETTDIGNSIYIYKIEWPD